MVKVEFICFVLGVEIVMLQQLIFLDFLVFLNNDREEACLCEEKAHF